LKYRLTIVILHVFLLQLSLFSQDGQAEPQDDAFLPDRTVFVIRGTRYLITGKTRETALDREGEFKTGERLLGLPALEEYVAEKIQVLNNLRALNPDKNSITYALGETEEDGAVPVYLEISVTDSSNLVILPEPKYDSNSGFTLSLKARDYNFMGTLTSLKIDLVWGSDDKDRSLLGFVTDLTLPFRAFGFNWTFISFNEFYYYITGEPAYNRNVLGIAMELPVSFTALTFGFEQGLVIHEENTERITKTFALDGYHSWYLYSKLFVDWKIPTPLRLGKFGRVVYTPGVYGTAKYQIDGDVGDYRQGPGAGIKQEISLGRIDWIGNFRQGLKISFYNDNEYNFFRQDWVNSLGVRADGHVRISKYFGISGRLLYTRWFNDFYDYGGDVIRGYKDNELFTNERLSLNLDFPVRLIRFVPSEWTGNSKYRYIDFEQHWVPFVDLLMLTGAEPWLYRASAGNTGFDGGYSFKPEDLITAIGLEVITFPLKWRSFYIRASIGWNIREWIRIHRPPSGIYREIYIGMGHYY